MFDVLMHECAKHASEYRQNKLVLRGANNGKSHRKCCLWIVGTWQPLEILFLRRR